MRICKQTRATKIWMRRVRAEAGEWPGHHHGEAATAGFILKGESGTYHVEDYEERVDLEEGGFIYVPPYFPHIESNRSEERPLEWLTARTPEN